MQSHPVIQRLVEARAYLVGPAAAAPGRRFWLGDHDTRQQGCAGAGGPWRPTAHRLPAHRRRGPTLPTFHTCSRPVASCAPQEKIRPIDKKLQYQIEKLLKAAAATAGAAGGAEPGADGGEAAAALGGGEDALAYGPRPDALVSKRGGGAAAAAGEEEGGGAGGVYRPPRLNPVSMELDERAGELSARERRQLVQAQRRAARSGLVQVRRGGGGDGARGMPGGCPARGILCGCML